MRMKTITHHTHPPRRHHIAIARKRGDDSLSATPPEEFYADAPNVAGFVRAESGCLISQCGNVVPHMDSWIGEARNGAGPRGQKSCFWLLRRMVTFKVDGALSCKMRAGDWVVFDHQREHMVLGAGRWLGAAWQLRPLPRARLDTLNAELTGPARRAPN